MWYYYLFRKWTWWMAYLDFASSITSAIDLTGILTAIGLTGSISLLI